MPVRRERKANVMALKESGMMEAAVEKLLDEVADGKMLSVACREANLHYPFMAAEIFTNAKWAARFDAAKRSRASFLAEETLAIADDLTGESAQETKKAELQIKVRQWMASKDDRDRWGEKVTVENVNINLVQIIEEAKARVNEVIDGTAERV